MRYREIFDGATAQNATVFDFTFSVAKLKEDGTTVTKSYSVNIPNDYAWQYCGRKKANDLVKTIYKNETTTAAQKLQRFKQILQPVIDSNRFKWAALFDSMELYFNPLWNVDGSEITEENRAARLKTENIGQKIDTIAYGQTQRTDQHGAQEESIAYGNGSSYTDSVQYGGTSKSITKGQETDSVQYGATQEQTQYGSDQTTDVYGARGKNTTHKVNPFNDAGNLYDTDKTVDAEDSATDTHTRGQHTDQTNTIQHTDQSTYGSRTDNETEQSHTDTTTHGAHTDKKTNATYSDITSETEHTDTKTNGTQQNTIGDAAFKDTITVTRHGNIGVTKSTDLLESYRQLMVDLYPIILDDIMKSVSRGY